MKQELSLVGLIFLTACGGFDGRMVAGGDILPPARLAVDAINATFGCEVVELREGDGGRWLDGESQVYFSEAMRQQAAGFMREERGNPERDIMVRPKTSFVEVNGTMLPTAPPEYDSIIVHELGHAFGLRHVDGIGEVMHPSGGDYRDPDKMTRFVEALRGAGAGCRR